MEDESEVIRNVLVVDSEREDINSSRIIQDKASGVREKRKIIENILGKYSDIDSPKVIQGIASEDRVNLMEIDIDSSSESIKHDKEFLLHSKIELSNESNTNLIQSDINCIELFSSILDTSQTFNIYKFLIKDEAINILHGILPEKFKLLGLYGDTDVIINFMKQFFNKELPEIRVTEGIYLFYSPLQIKGALVYFTNDEMLYKSRPIKTSSRLTTIIRVMSDLCYKSIACISSELLDN